MHVETHFVARDGKADRLELELLRTLKGQRRQPAGNIAAAVARRIDHALGVASSSQSGFEERFARSTTYRRSRTNDFTVRTECPGQHRRQRESAEAPDVRGAFVMHEAIKHRFVDKLQLADACDSTTLHLSNEEPAALFELHSQEQERIREEHQAKRNEEWSAAWSQVERQLGPGRRVDGGTSAANRSKSRPAWTCPYLQAAQLDSRLEREPLLFVESRLATQRRTAKL